MISGHLCLTEKEKTMSIKSWKEEYYPAEASAPKTNKEVATAYKNPTISTEIG